MADRERQVEQYLRRRVEELGGRCVKFDPGTARGWPDRIVLLPRGHLIWAELKRPVGGRLSDAQRVAHEELKRLGQYVVVLRSREEVDEFLKGQQREKL